MKVFKTNCPYCEEGNIFEVPTYQESVDELKDDLEKTGDTSFVDLIEDWSSEKDLSALNEDYMSDTPIFCKECGHSYFLNDVLPKTAT